MNLENLIGATITDALGDGWIEVTMDTGEVFKLEAVLNFSVAHFSAVAELAVTPMQA